MSAQTVQTLVEQLHHAGLKLSLTSADVLAVSPTSRLTEDLRDLIRRSKTQLIDWLTAANDANSPVDDAGQPDDWKALAAAYHAHHFKCPTCIAAGRGTRYGQRCGAGMALWNAYSTAVVRPTP